MARRMKSEQEQARQFALTLPVVLGVFALIFYTGFWFWAEKPRLALGLLIAAPLINLVALVLPALWLRFFRLWMKLAEALGWVMTRVILSLFFLLVLTPFGLVMRWIGKRPLDLAWKDGRPTYWVDKEPGEYTLERYERQF